MADAGDLILADLGTRLLNRWFGDPAIEQKRAEDTYKLALSNLTSGIAPSSVGMKQPDLEKQLGPDAAAHIAGLEKSEWFKAQQQHSAFQQQNRALLDRLQSGFQQITEDPSGFNYPAPAGMYAGGREDFDPNIQYAQPPSTQQVGMGGAVAGGGEGRGGEPPALDFGPAPGPRLAPGTVGATMRAQLPAAPRPAGAPPMQEVPPYVLSEEARAQDVGQQLMPAGQQLTDAEVARRFERLSPTAQAILATPDIGRLTQDRLSKAFAAHEAALQRAFEQHQTKVQEAGANFRTATNAAAQLIGGGMLQGATASDIPALRDVIMNKHNPRADALAVTSRLDLAGVQSAYATITKIRASQDKLATDLAKNRKAARAASGKLEQYDLKNVSDLVAAYSMIPGATPQYVMQGIHDMPFFQDGAATSFAKLPPERRAMIEQAVTEAMQGGTPSITGPSGDDLYQQIRQQMGMGGVAQAAEAPGGTPAATPTPAAPVPTTQAYQGPPSYRPPTPPPAAAVLGPGPKRRRLAAPVPAGGFRPYPR